MPLCPDGATKQVTKANIEFIDLVLKARFSEANEQMQALQGGINTVFDNKLGILSFLDWESVEIRACGEKTIDVSRLKSITSYPNCGNDHAIVGRFWRVFEAFSEEEKASYLKFVWGRSRLPIDTSNLAYYHQLRLMTNMSNTGFPQSHTCFFQLDIPDY